MAATAIGPIGARQINQSFFVGQSDLTTIQKAVNAAVQNGGGIAIIPFDYAGSDTIAAITGGQTYVEIHDYRNPSVQAYVWWNNQYIAADFTQAGNAIIDGFMHIKGTLEVDGNSDLKGTLTVEQDASIYGNCGIIGALSVNGPTQLGGGLAGPIEVSGDLVASGNIQAVTITATNSMIAHTMKAAIANESYFVGPGGFATIQAAVTAAVSANGGTVVVPWDYAGSDSIQAVTGGANNVMVKDYRNPSVQAWVWNNGPSYNVPATFEQAGNLIIRGVSEFDGHVSMGGNLDVTGNLTAQDAKFSTCEINGIPVKNMVFPPVGLGVSTGSAWGTSIDPTTLQGKLALTTTGSTGPATLVGNALNIPQYSGGATQVYPAAGIGVSTGTAWGTSIDPATLQGKLTLTTTGTSGPSTLAGNALNIPQYSGGATQVYPPVGVAVSTGTAWGTSLNPNKIPMTNVINTFSVDQNITGNLTLTGNLTSANYPLVLTTTGSSGPATLAGNTLNIPQYSGGASMVYPAAGIGVSTGSAWGTSIPAADVARLSLANIFTASAAASTAALALTGAPFSGTGTTAFPLLYLNGGATPPTSWSTAGTVIGINYPAGFTGNILDFHSNGSSSIFSVLANGSIVATQITVASTGASLNGNASLQLRNSGATATGMIGWSAATTAGTPDTALYRYGIGVLAIGSGTGIGVGNDTGSLRCANITASGTCNVAGSPVVTVATLPAQVYPAAGIALSTGTAWGTAIDPATIPRTNVANTFAANQTITGTLTASGDVIAGPVHVGASVSDAARATIACVGADLFIFPPSGNGTTALAWSGGSGGVKFGNGASAQVANVDGAGNANFVGMKASGGLTVGGSQGTFVANTLHLGYGGGIFYVDSVGANPATQGEFIFRTLSSDISLVTNVITMTSTGVAIGGTLSATGAKTFRIPHPLDETKDLIHACLEGPENGVYYRGEAQVVDGYAVVTLPDYFEALTFPEDRSIQLTQVWEDTPIFARLAASRVVDGQFTIHATDDVTVAWEVKAVRRIGVERLKVVQDRPDPLLNQGQAVE